MKKTISFTLVFVMIFLCASCSAPSSVELQVSQMKSICELAVMDCYYHNVAKFTEKDAQGFLWWKKDKRFWIEYSGVVKLGIDVSLVNVEVEDTQVTITLPEAKVLGCKVDSASLTKDAYIVEAGSADIEAADEVMAFREAQSELEKAASNNKALLAGARQRVKDLLENYIRTIEENAEEDYTIKWVYLDTDGDQTGTSMDETGATAEPEVSEQP